MVTHTGGPKGLKWNWDFPLFFSLGKKILVHWGWESETKKEKKRELDWDLGQNQASQWDLGKSLAWICDLQPPLSLLARRNITQTSVI